MPTKEKQMKKHLTPYTIQDETESNYILDYIRESISEILSENIEDYIELGYDPADPSVGIMGDSIFLDYIAHIEPFVFELDIEEIFLDQENSIDFITEKKELDLYIPDGENFFYTFNLVTNRTLNLLSGKRIELENYEMELYFKFKIRYNHYDSKVKKYYLVLDFQDAKEK